MNGNRQWCRWFQILWLSKPLQTLVPEPFSPLDVLSERKPLSPPCHRNQLAFGVIGNAAVSTTAAEMGVGVGVGGRVVLQPCFLSLRKHRSLCEGKTSLTLRNRDLVLVGWFLQSGPTAAALTDALITRPFWKKKSWRWSWTPGVAVGDSGVEAWDSLAVVEDVEGDETKPHKPLALCVYWPPLVVLPNRTNHVQYPEILAAESCWISKRNNFLSRDHS